MELHDLLPCAQEHTTGPYTELDASTFLPYFLKIHSNIILPIYVQVELSLPFRFYNEFFSLCCMIHTSSLT